MKGGDEEKVVNLAFFFLLSFLPLRPVNPPSIIVVDVLNGMAESGAKNERLIESYSLSLSVASSNHDIIFLRPNLSLFILWLANQPAPIAIASHTPCDPRR